MNKTIYNFYDTEHYGDAIPLIYNNHCKCSESEGGSGSSNNEKDEEQDKEIEKLKEQIKINSENIAKNATEIDANTEADKAREINIYYEENENNN